MRYLIRQKIFLCSWVSERNCDLLSLGERLVYEQKFTSVYGVSLFPTSIISGGVSIATSFYNLLTSSYMVKKLIH